MSATQTVPVVVPVAPVVAVAPNARVATVTPVARVAPVTPGRRPSRGPSRGPTKAHKNADFVLESAENGGSEGQKRTKMPILCSGRGGLASGREVIGTGKRNRCLPANHRARF